MRVNSCGKTLLSLLLTPKLKLRIKRIVQPPHHILVISCRNEGARLLLLLLLLLPVSSVLHRILPPLLMDAVRVVKRIEVIRWLLILVSELLLRWCLLLILLLLLLLLGRRGEVHLRLLMCEKRPRLCIWSRLEVHRVWVVLILLMHLYLSNILLLG